jgi:hypothetical protein
MPSQLSKGNPCLETLLLAAVEVEAVGGAGPPPPLRYTIIRHSTAENALNGMGVIRISTEDG